MLSYLHYLSSDLMSHKQDEDTELCNQLAVDYLLNSVFLLVNFRAAMCKEKKKKKAMLIYVPSVPQIRQTYSILQQA